MIPQGKLVGILGFNFCVGHFFTHPLEEAELVTTQLVSTEVQQNKAYKHAQIAWDRYQKSCFGMRISESTPCLCITGPGWLRNDKPHTPDVLAVLANIEISKLC